MSKFLLHIETSKHLSIKLYFQLIKMFIVELNDPYVATEKAQVSLIQSKRGLTLITFPGEWIVTNYQKREKLIQQAPTIRAVKMY